MTYAEYRKACERRAQIRSQRDDIQATLAKENRSLTDEESRTIGLLRAEDDKLYMDCLGYEQEQRDQTLKAQRQQRNAVSADVALIQIIRSMSRGAGIPDEFAALRSNQSPQVLNIPYSGADLQLRGADPNIQQTAEVGPVTPISIREIIKELEPASIIGQLGLHIQSGIQGQWNYPVVGGGSADWADENEEAAYTKINLDKIAPSPHRLPCRIAISNQAIWQSAGAIRTLMINRMRELVVNRLNTTMLSLTAPSNDKTPKGPFLTVPTANIITVAGLLTTVTRQNLFDLRTQVNGKSNVPLRNPAFLINWATYAYLANLPLDKGSGRFVLDIATNTIDGVKTLVSNYVPDGYILYGNFGYEMLGQFGPMTMTVDSQSAAVASKEVTEVVINSRWDMMPAYKEAFGYIKYKLE